MNDARQFFTATRLADGSVLVAGGLGKAGYLDSAELYDPLTQTFKYTGSMSIRRDLHVSTLLADGRVLVTGGISQKGRNSRTVATAEIFDPRKGKFAPTGSMAVPRAQHTATLLNNGKVLIVGGSNDDSVPATAELYDPVSGTFSLTDGTSVPIGSGETATPLYDGRVLVVGSGITEVYDPSLGTFSPTVGSMITPRNVHTATLLFDGAVLLAGGTDASGNDIAQAELYDPSSDTFNPGGAMVTPRDLQTASLLIDGRVLIAGGHMAPQQGGIADAELYDPALHSFSRTDSLSDARIFHTETPLVSGAVLIAGGGSWTGSSLGFVPLVSAELYHP